MSAWPTGSSSHRLHGWPPSWAAAAWCRARTWPSPCATAPNGCWPSWGPGQPWTRFTGICETLLVTGCTPVELDTVHLRFAFTQQRADRDVPRAGVARAIIKDICRQLDQDKVVWDRQRHVAQPLLCDGDGPIRAFRNFFSQFYAELHRETGPRVVTAQNLQRRARR